MKSRNQGAIKIFRSPFGARFAPIRLRGRWVRQWRVPQPPVAANALRKLLKTERLWVFRFGAEVPSFQPVHCLPKRGHFCPKQKDYGCFGLGQKCPLFGRQWTG